MQKGRVRKYERENIFDTMKTDEKVSGHVLCGSCDQPAGGAVALYRAVDVWPGFPKSRRKRKAFLPEKRIYRNEISDQTWRYISEYGEKCTVYDYAGAAGGRRRPAGLFEMRRRKRSIWPRRSLQRTMCSILPGRTVKSSEMPV